MRVSNSKQPVRKAGPRGVAYAFLFAFALSVGTIIFTGLQVRAPDPERRQRMEALREMQPPVPAPPPAVSERDDAAEVAVPGDDPATLAPVMPAGGATDSSRSAAESPR